MADMQEQTIAEAVRDGLAEILSGDPLTFLIGEDIGKAGGVFNVYDGLLDEFGPDRVMNSPISEAGIAGLGVGAAMAGMHPIVDIMFGDFMTLAMDQIVNQAAKMYYMTGGQVSVPLVIRTTLGAGRSSGAQHSQSLHAWLAHIPGVKVVVPSTPADAKGLLKTAVRDPNPVIIFEDKMMYKLKGPVPTHEFSIPFGVADIKRTGKDVTIVATSSMVHVALKAAETLAQENISAEVVDPRTIKPLDTQTILASVKKTHRAVVIDEGYRSFGITGEIASLIGDEAFDYLDAPVKRIGAEDVPVPLAPGLEFSTIPDEARLVQTVKSLFGRRW
ncbi:MAG: alpha-ketoacid dehydrogenase subunit beta [Caldilineaceae bacterium]